MIEVDRPVGDRRRLAALWFAMLGGAAAWSGHLLASYPLVRVSCRLETTAILHTVTGFAVLIGVMAASAGWREWRRLHEEGRPGGEASDLRYRRACFMAVAGAIISGFFAIVTLAEGLPVFFGDPCLRGP